MRLKTNLASDAVLMLTTLIWGSTFVIAKDLLQSWPPIPYITVRFGLAAVALVALFAARVMKARAETWRAGMILGVLMGGGFALQAIGQVYTTPAKSAFITGLTTPLVPFVAFVTIRVRPNLENLIGVTLASIGGLLILAPEGETGINTGDIFTLCATVLFALHIAFLSVYAQRYDFRQLATLQIAAAAALFVISWILFRVLFGSSIAGVPHFISGRAMWQLVYLALVATVVTFLLWTWGQARTSATHAAIIFSLEPVFATLFAVAVNGSGEWMARRGNIGAGLILAGVLVSELRLTARQKQEF
jgi:drug/metabolite transporter (DMT)-like permease